MSLEYYIVLACALVSLIYGALTSKQILATSDGTEKMKEIAKAIQEGAI
jgi:K(+)-stimulated pyrophosphate-energized sodium pump